MIAAIAAALAEKYEATKSRLDVLVVEIAVKVESDLAA